MSENFLVSLLNESIKTDDTKKAMVVTEGILKARNDSSDMNEFEKYIHAAASSSSIVSSTLMKTKKNKILSIAYDAPAETHDNSEGVRNLMNITQL